MPQRSQHHAVGALPGGAQLPGGALGPAPGAAVLEDRQCDTDGRVCLLVPIAFLLPGIGLGLYLVLWALLPWQDGTIPLERLLWR